MLAGTVKGVIAVLWMQSFMAFLLQDGHGLVPGYAGVGLRCAGSLRQHLDPQPLESVASHH